jgi:3-phosphoshikimate 1-carboxyvinyltransferase
VTEVDSLEIRPAVRIQGVVAVPGDKAITHRLAMIGAIARGRTVIRNFSESADCGSTLECLRRLGIPIHHQGTTVIVEGAGLFGFKKPSLELDAGNSGTTVRFMTGLVAGSPFESTFVGDESLSRRPMKRVIDPIRRFGATIEARDDNFLPLKITGGTLRAIDFTMPIASAQVKSAVLFAGLHASGTTSVREPIQSRNHTELALKEFGARIEVADNTIEIEGGHELEGKECTVPGDMSSAAFFIAAALATRDSKLRLTNVGLNPTRAGFVRLLQELGANITMEKIAHSGGESAGDVVVESSEILGMDIGGAWIPNVIDEIPVIAVLGTRTQRGVRIRDAGELRVKESDRILAVATNLRALGAVVDEYPDGLFVPGGQRLRGGTVDSFGDHRIAMAFAVAALFADAPVVIKNPSCAAISFPSFFQLLNQVTRSG